MEGNGMRKEEQEKEAYRFVGVLELVVDEERQELGRLGAQVHEVLEVRDDLQFALAVLFERLLQHAVELVLQLQQRLHSSAKHTEPI